MKTETKQLAEAVAKELLRQFYYDAEADAIIKYETGRENAAIKESRSINLPVVMPDGRLVHVSTAALAYILQTGKAPRGKVKTIDRPLDFSEDNLLDTKRDGWFTARKTPLDGACELIHTTSPRHNAFAAQLLANFKPQ